MPEAPELLDEAPVGGSPAGRAANAAVRAFSKAARAFTLYDPQNEAVRRFLQEYRDAMAAFLGAHGALDLEVRPTELVLKGEVVHAERDREKSLASRLHRDGIRRLCIQPSAAWDEELKLLEVLSVRFIGVRQQEEDLVTLLTRQAFRSITFASVAGVLAAEPDAEARPERAKHEFPADFDGPAPPLLPPRQFGYFEIPPSALQGFADEETPQTLPENAVRMVRELLDDAGSEDELKTLVPAVEEVRDFLLAELEVKHLRDLARVVAGQHGKAAATLGPALKPLAAPHALQKLLSTIPEGAEPPDELLQLLDALAAYGADLLDPLLDRLEQKPGAALQQLALRAAHGNKEKLLERLQRAATPAGVQALLAMIEAVDPDAAQDAGKAAFEALLQQVLDKDAAGTLDEADADAMGAAMAALQPGEARGIFGQWVHPPQSGLLGKLKAKKPRRMLAWTAAAGLQNVPGSEAAAMLRELTDLAQQDEDLRKRCLKAMSLQRRARG